MRDNPDQDLSGLNRDPDRAQEITKDKKREEDLYISSNSVEKVGEAAEYAHEVYEVRQRAQARNEMPNGSPDERSDAARKLFQYQMGDAAGTEPGQLVANRLADLARQDPAAANEALDLLRQLQGPGGPSGSASFAQAIGAGAVVLLVGVLVGGEVIANNPEYQQKLADALAKLSDSERRRLENLADLLGTDGFPIHKGELGKFISPIPERGASTPDSNGYGAGGKVELPASTGGSRIVEPSGSSMTTPAETDPSLRPGAMINENGQDGAKGSMKASDLGGVDDCIASQTQNLNRKLGEKIGQGRLPFEKSKTGVEQAKATVRDALSNITSVSEVISKDSVRGDYDLIHVYSAKTNSTVSLRVLPGGKYEFDTLIPEKSSKF